MVEIISKHGRSFQIQIRGNHNHVKIGKNCVLTNTMITMDGDNNRLIVDDNVRFYGPCKIIMNGNATLHIGDNAGVRGVEFVVKDGTIEIGELCMFSYGIVVRNHDSHRVLNGNSVLNPAKNIRLGKHVWICQNASILKGAEIGDNSIVAYAAVVTKGCDHGCIIAGNPAKIVKENISWDY